jgi:ATP/ADP translocase
VQSVSLFCVVHYGFSALIEFMPDDSSVFRSFHHPTTCSVYAIIIVIIIIYLMLRNYMETLNAKKDGKANNAKKEKQIINKLQNMSSFTISRFLCVLCLMAS